MNNVRTINVKRLLVFGLPLALILYFVNAYVGFVSFQTFNPYKNAIGQLAIAESAQTSEEVSKHIIGAKAELSRSGYVGWWPVQRDKFESVELELDDIISHASNISSLDSQNEMYISEMFYIHNRLQMIQQSLSAF